MVRALVLAIVLVLGGAKASDPALVGNWAIEGHTYLTFNADGTGDTEGKPFTWKAANNLIDFVGVPGGEKTQVGYLIDHGQLGMLANGVPLLMTRAAKGSKVAATTPKEEKASKGDLAKAPKADASEAKGKAGGKDDLAKLLASSAWCSFHYSQVSGTSSSERFWYGADGLWGKGRRAETYSSGYGGTVAGQSDSSDGGHWKTENNKLFMTQGESVFAPIPLEVYKNSNGYPIIKSNGTEYSMCK